ncbi:MAG: hypothetical protein E7384_03465 [Ruminococcaceae bacterium]|nr:hypothetical protein [Oscillospiraceae bacterium]
MGNLQAKKRIVCMMLALVFSLQLFLLPEMVSHGAQSTELTFNGEKVAANISGYSSANNGNYTFSSKLTIEFDEPSKGYFNRYTIEYISDVYISGTVYYKLDGRTKREEFFLESGTKASFSSLIDGYLDSKTGNRLEKIVFEPLSKDTASLRILSIKTTTYDVFKSETAYIENDRFKVGCCLIWGGGLNYIEDKKDNDSTVTNMLNHCDTGRLVQQSYYGTSESPYRPGYYNNSVWGYNPVQGGDQHGNKSKLVDFSINTDTIYVKCRPLDWSKDDEATPSYMENVYKLEKDHIKVDNRFIDFSGYSHGKARHQELPAFYTISYLDTFTFYNGTKPWTGGDLTVKKNLPFWGDPSTNAQCYFNVKKGNTETWCAWTSSEKKYGLGLYTPNVSILLAGRHAYNGSKDPADSATNYVAPLITSLMQSYEPFQYSYYITAGSVETIRSVFTQNKTNQTYADLSYDTTNLSFDKSYEVNALTGIKNVTITHDATKGAAVYKAPATATSYKGDCDSYSYIYFSSDVNTQNYRYIVFSYMLPTTNMTNDYNAEFFVCTGTRQKAESGYSHKESLTRDGKFHSVVIDMYTKKAENGSYLWPSGGERLNCIRLDFDKAMPNDMLYITGFGLAKTLSEANNYASEFLKTPSSGGSTTPSQTPGSNIVIPTFDPEITSGVATAPSVPATSAPAGETEQPTQTPDCESPLVTDVPVSPGNNENSDENVDYPDDEYIEEDEYNSSGISMFGIIAIIAGVGLLIIAGAIILIVVLVKKKKKKAAANIAAEPAVDLENDCSII